jgi:hypothetical protein
MRRPHCCCSSYQLVWFALLHSRSPTPQLLAVQLLRARGWPRFARPRSLHRRSLVPIEAKTNEAYLALPCCKVHFVVTALRSVWHCCDRHHSCRPEAGCRLRCRQSPPFQQDQGVARTRHSPAVESRRQPVMRATPDCRMRSSRSRIPADAAADAAQLRSRSSGKSS